MKEFKKKIIIGVDHALDDIRQVVREELSEVSFVSRFLRNTERRIPN